MRDELRPLSFGEILDRTITLYRSRFLAFLGISAVPTVALIAVVVAIGIIAFSGGLFRPTPSPATMGLTIALIVLGVLLALPLTIGATSLAYAALCHAAGVAYFGGSITIRGSYRAIWKRGWHYVWLYVLIALIAGGVPAAAFMFMEMMVLALAFLAKDTAGAVLGGFLVFLMFVAIVVYVILALIRMSLAFPICVTERVSAWAAVKRSNSLSRNSRGRIFLLFLLAYVVSIGISGSISALTVACVFLIPGVSQQGRMTVLLAVVYLVSYAAQFIVQALIQPLFGISLTLFYYDQRVRHEGFDIEWKMYRAGLIPPAPVPAAPPQPVSQPWMAPDGRFAADPSEMAATAAQQSDVSATLDELHSQADAAVALQLENDSAIVPAVEHPPGEGVS
jgi:hypothetical protein